MKACVSHSVVVRTCKDSKNIALRKSVLSKDVSHIYDKFSVLHVLNDLTNGKNPLT